MTIHLALNWRDTIGAVGGMVILICRSWLTSKAVDIGERLTVRAEKWLVKTERDAIEWWHYRDRAARAGHTPKKVVDCHDGKCVVVTR